MAVSSHPRLAQHLRQSRRVTLKQMAARLGLSPATISLVLNNADGVVAIPQKTRKLILDLAREVNYKPNFLARSLRRQRTYSIGVLIPELSDGYSSLVLDGIEEYLLEAGYIYLVASHRHNTGQIENHPKLFFERSVEGLIVVDTPYRGRLSVPVVAVSGHAERRGITNVVVDHDRAAELGLRHLCGLGHSSIAFIRGQAFSSDTEIRWWSIKRVAEQQGITIRDELVAELEGVSPSPETGYLAMRQILSRGAKFTALFSFNDVSAIGAMRALREAGLRVPEDVSVLGFDDIHSAAYYNPALTTIRQPLSQMGRLAAETLVKQLNHPQGDHARTLTLQPELVVRESTASRRSDL